MKRMSAIAPMSKCLDQGAAMPPDVLYGRSAQAPALARSARAQNREQFAQRQPASQDRISALRLRAMRLRRLCHGSLNEYSLGQVRQRRRDPGGCQRSEITFCVNGAGWFYFCVRRSVKGERLPAGSRRPTMARAGRSDTAVWSLSASSKGMLWTSLPVNLELECCPAGLGAQSILPSGMTRLRSTIFGGTRSTTIGGWRRSGSAP